MMPPVHTRIFFARDFFFTGRRPRRLAGSSGGAPRRRRGPGTSALGVAFPGDDGGDCRSGSAARERAGPPFPPPVLPEADLRGPGTGDCGAEVLSRSSYSPVSGLSTHWSAGSMFSARPRPCASTVVRILRRGHAAPFPLKALGSRSRGARPQEGPRGRVHRIAHTIRPVQRRATAVTNSTPLQPGNSPHFFELLFGGRGCLGKRFTRNRPRRRCFRGTWARAGWAKPPREPGRSPPEAGTVRGRPTPKGRISWEVPGKPSPVCPSAADRRVSPPRAPPVGRDWRCRRTTPAERSGIAHVRWECSAGRARVRTGRADSRDPGSVVREVVAASSTGYSFTGFSRTSLLCTLLTSAPRNRCCRSIRPVSLPLPRDLRARTYPSACSPSSVTLPGRQPQPGRLVADRLGQADLDPVHRVDHVLEPAEVDDHVVVDPHPGELLHRADRAGRTPGLEGLVELANIGSVCVPSGRRHPGTSTIRSRGRETAVALRRPAARCSRIVVSDRSDPRSRPYSSLPSPDRESEPISRMFCRVLHRRRRPLLRVPRELRRGRVVGRDVPVELHVEGPPGHPGPQDDHGHGPRPVPRPPPPAPSREPAPVGGRPRPRPERPAAPPCEVRHVRSPSRFRSRRGPASAARAREPSPTTMA